MIDDKIFRWGNICASRNAFIRGGRGDVGFLIGQGPSKIRQVAEIKILLARGFLVLYFLF